MTHVSEDQFESAHRKLDHALPGASDGRKRYRRWSETQLIPRRLLPAGIEALSYELRRRSREMFDLPAGEEARFELVTGKLYAGNADSTPQALIAEGIACHRDPP